MFKAFYSKILNYKDLLIYFPSTMLIFRGLQNARQQAMFLDLQHISRKNEKIIIKDAWKKKIFRILWLQIQAPVYEDRLCIFLYSNN